MSRFGIFSFPGTGHLHPLTALGRELIGRGHEVVLFQVADFEPLVRSAGLEFHRIGDREFPLGSLRPLDQTLGRLQGTQALAFIFERFRQNSAMVLREGPEVVRSESIDALIVDQAELAGGTVAEKLELPFVTAICTLPLNLDANVPFFCFNANLDTGRRARIKNAVRNSWIRFLSTWLCELVNRQRRVWRLSPNSGLDSFGSPLAQIAQLPRCFDFPRRKLPTGFHYAGPFLDRSARPEIAFPWERLDTSRPLVYVCMGTLQNGVERVFRIVAETCASLPVQTVISLGGGLPAGALGALPGDPIVVRYAPQLELLRKAALTVFHGGLNTALESLSCGVPMVAIPVTMDQPGVAARIMWTNTGRTIPVTQLTMERLRLEIKEVLTKPGYRAQAQHLQRLIAANRGVARAAELIERALMGRSFPCIPELADGLNQPIPFVSRRKRFDYTTPHATPPCVRGE
jgi:zeaxanthin glucosyltransferase